MIEDNAKTILGALDSDRAWTDDQTHGRVERVARRMIDEITRLRSDLAAALERAEKAENSLAMYRDLAREERRHGEMMEAERDAALERERMALWALALERLEALPEGWSVVPTGHYRLAYGPGGVMIRQAADGTWSAGIRARGPYGPRTHHRTALAAILSIDPTAKPPPGWTP